MISVEKLTVDFGGFTLFDDISFVVNPKDRIALVGKNGAGKSTMLKIFAGLQSPTRGNVSVPKGITIGYLPQHMIHKDNRTVMDEASLAFENIKRMQTEIDALNNALATRTDYDSPEYHEIIEEVSYKMEVLQMSNAGNFEAEIEKTLFGLGFSRTDFTRKTSEFSGGWRMRIELAKLLLQRPDVLLLDEPTNHLDIESIQWLEKFLASHANAVILVSHDRAFIDAVTNRTIEISLGQIYDYKVSYSKYVELRKERREQQIRAYENQQKQIQDTEDFIERFRYKATKAVQVQSRIKQLEKIDRLEIDLEDNSALRLKFPPAPRAGDIVIDVEGLKKEYKAPPSPPEGGGVSVCSLPVNISYASSSPSSEELGVTKFGYLTANIAHYGLLKEFAQNMRRFSTEAEAALWEMLRRKNLDVRFRKQHIIGDFIADFVCLKEKLIIEVDGGYHNEPEAAEYDKIRTQILNDSGFTVIRFSNEEVLANTDNVFTQIKNALTLTSPPSGGLGGALTVFSNANLQIKRGEKVAFVGKNGEGKSTLVKCIMNEITDYEGKLKIGHNVKIGYFAQNQASLLDETETVFETIDYVATGDVRTKIRDILGAFMFGGEASDKKVKVLSGGERSRLAMIRLLLEPVNLLILDEPTNHLDMRSKDVLKEAILAFDGTAIVVSHDREFLDGLVTKVYEFGGGKVRENLGGIYDFLRRKNMDSLAELGKSPVAAAGTASAPAPAQSENKQNYEQRKEQQKKIRKAERNVEEAEEKIAKAESDIKALETKMAEGTADNETLTSYGKKKRELEQLMYEWEILIEELEELRGN